MIDRINKYYTDGNVVLLEKMLNIDENTSRILIKITNPINHERNTTFLLTVNNDRKYKQFESRTIQITGFDFNSEYLPTEDELSSYEIPSTLKLNK